MKYNTNEGITTENIMFVIGKVLGASSPETSVDASTIIDTGISMDIWETYPRDGHDGHPVWPLLSQMCGIGGTGCNEEPYLHRANMRKGGQKRFFYWIDKSYRHEIVYQEDDCVADDGQRYESPIPRIQIDRTINPEIAEKAKAYLKERKNLDRPINYLLKAVNGEHTLTVQIVDDRFFNIQVTTENADRVLGCIPYCINFPAMAYTAIPGIQMVNNRKLANKWAEVSK